MAALSYGWVAGAAAYEAAQTYGKHVESNGKPESHASAKDIISGFVSTIIDRIVDTHNHTDSQKAKEDATQHVHKCLAVEYEITEEIDTNVYESTEVTSTQDEE